jgi:hypothetical protein
VAWFRYEEDSKISACIPVAIRLENGIFLELEGLINLNFKNRQNIWVILEDEFIPGTKKLTDPRIRL